jgi:hypothetical protein
LQFVQENYGAKLTKGWIHTFLGCHRDAIHVCRSLPQEDTRQVIPRKYLERHIQTIRELVQRKASELVFNLDEVESSDWEDRKPKKVVVPASVQEENVYHPISHSFKHLSLLAYVSEVGDSLTFLIIIADPIPDSLWVNGLCEDEDAIVRHRSPPYIVESIFFEYITHVLVPYVTYVRTKPELAREYAIVLMNSASPHVSDRVLRALGKNRIMAVLFPTHTTNIFQALDLVLFDAMKGIKKTANGDFGDDSVQDYITKLLQAYEQVAISFTIHGVFRKAGLIPEFKSRLLQLRFSEDVLRANPCFSEIWNFNISLDQLSKWRQSHQFGLINADFLARYPGE